MIIAVHEVYETAPETQTYFLDLDKVAEPIHSWIVSELSSEYPAMEVHDMQEYRDAIENAFVDLPALVENLIDVYGP